MVTDNPSKSRHQFSQLEGEIDKLRRERDEQAALVAQMREQVADYDVLIGRLTEAFAKLKAGHELQQRGETARAALDVAGARQVVASAPYGDLR